jgi:hypothetical protein
MMSVPHEDLFNEANRIWSASERIPHAPPIIEALVEKDVDLLPERLDAHRAVIRTMLTDLLGIPVLPSQGPASRGRSSERLKHRGRRPTQPDDSGLDRRTDERSTTV